jgi:hypothetical protein
MKNEKGQKSYEILSHMERNASPKVAGQLPKSNEHHG